MCDFDTTIDLTTKSVQGGERWKEGEGKREEVREKEKEGKRRERKRGKVKMGKGKMGEGMKKGRRGKEEEERGKAR